MKKREEIEKIAKDQGYVYAAEKHLFCVGYLKGHEDMKNSSITPEGIENFLTSFMVDHSLARQGRSKETEYQVLLRYKNAFTTIIKKPDTSLLRDCWSLACASGYRNFPSLTQMQADFEKFLTDRNIEY